MKIDITDDGVVSICGTDQAMMDCAVKLIQIIVTDFKEGQLLEGTVVSIKEFGAFVEFAPGKEGMVHISKIAKERINRVEDVLTLGDKAGLYARKRQDGQNELQHQRRKIKKTWRHSFL